MQTVCQREILKAAFEAGYYEWPRKMESNAELHQLTQRPLSTTSNSIQSIRPVRRAISAIPPESG